MDVLDGGPIFPNEPSQKQGETGKTYQRTCSGIEIIHTPCVDMASLRILCIGDVWERFRESEEWSMLKYFMRLNDIAVGEPEPAFGVEGTVCLYIGPMPTPILDAFMGLDVWTALHDVLARYDSERDAATNEVFVHYYHMRHVDLKKPVSTVVSDDAEML